MALQHGWRRVTAKHPCPICSKGNWCTVSIDGHMAACRRVEAGAFKTKADKNGDPVYLHRMDGVVTFPTTDLPPLASGSAVERADADTLHRVYSALLAALTLNQAGRARCRPDGTVRPIKPPRGLFLSTGEDTPRGHSLHARKLALEISRDELNWERA
jgi:hypothetical protein